MIGFIINLERSTLLHKYNSKLSRGSLVIVEGRAPIWGYGMALHKLHASPAVAIAFYDPRLGEVVVATHNQEWKVSQEVDVTLPVEK